MKHSLFIIFGLVLISFSDVPVKYPVYLNKKITKEIKKAFSDEEIATEIVDDAIFNPNYKETDLILVKNKTNQELGYVTVTLASACKIGGCTMGAEKASEEEYGTTMSEEFYFMTIYDVNNVIQKIKILEYDATYGYEISARGWLKQFIGKVGGSLKYDKDIDGISGATISVKSLIKEVNQQDQFLNNITVR